MELVELQKHWDALGKSDPLWAILSLPEKRFGKWDLAEFFGYGREEIDQLWAFTDELGIPRPVGKALDFGCGVGRLTQALCAHFDECVGIDISPSMIEGAQRLNQYGDRCTYVLNGRDDLSIFQDGEFQFIYSIIVLQHMRPDYMKKYLKEFLRILAPGGLVVFQIPGENALTGFPEVETKPVSVVELEPLPDSGFQAKLEFLELPASFSPGAPQPIRVRVLNQSDQTWHNSGLEDGGLRIKVGNHWLDEAGNPIMSAYDDGRVELPEPIPSGHQFEVEFVVHAPQTPGRYMLEVDVVQEHVSWFGTKGSPTARATVEVEASESFVPKIEMYFIPKDEVVSFIEQHGGTVLEVQEVSSPQSYRDFKYFVRK